MNNKETYRFLVTIIFILFFIHSSLAQTDSITPGKLYKTWIKMKNKPHKMKGVLFEIRDSSIMVSNSLNREDYVNGQFDVLKVDIRMMDAIKIRTQNNGWKVANMGYYSGLLAGGVIGCVYFWSSPEGDDDVLVDSSMGAFLGTILGGIIGALIPENINITINGSQAQFEKNKNMLRSYSIKYNSMINKLHPIN